MMFKSLHGLAQFSDPNNKLTCWDLPQEIASLDLKLKLTLQESLQEVKSTLIWLVTKENV